MAFWAELPEPSRQYRWYIQFSQEDLTPVRYALKKAARPTMKISEVKHKYLNHEFYYPGRVEWDPISISIASAKTDPDKGDTTNSILMSVLRGKQAGIVGGSGYVYPTGVNADLGHINTISKKNAVNALAKGNHLQLIQVDYSGKDEEKWYLFNPFFTDVKYDTLEYASEEIMTVDCTIKYDWASYESNSGATI